MEVSSINNHKNTQYRHKTRQTGWREQAEKLYREILRIDPKHPNALHLVGVIANEAGNQEMVVEYISRAIALRPDIAEYCTNLGNALQAAEEVAQELSQVPANTAAGRRKVIVVPYHAGKPTSCPTTQ